LRLTLRRRAGAVLLAAAAACLLAACGGGGNEEDARRLLDQAFSNEIRSANLELDAQLEVKGSRALDRPVRIRATGPYRSNEGKLPSLDLDFRINAGGGGQTVETGFVSTGDRSFIKFQGVYYEQPASEVARTNRLLGRGRGRESSLKALGLDPRSWLRDAKEEGSDDIAGVESDHVSGTLDVGRLVRDFNDLIRRSGRTIAGAAGGPVPEPLSQSDIDKVADVVQDPSFDVYVGKEDKIVRRVAGRLELEVPEDDRAAVGGIEGGSVQFSIEFSDVNGDQRIEAPAKARPLSDLTRSLGTGALGGAGGGTGGGSGGGAGGGTQSAPQGGSSPDPEAFKDYAECLDKAKPQDTPALQRCAELLQ
jgi:hypothetical protein